MATNQRVAHRMRYCREQSATCVLCFVARSHFWVPCRSGCEPGDSCLEGEPWQAGSAKACDVMNYEPGGRSCAGCAPTMPAHAVPMGCELLCVPMLTAATLSGQSHDPFAGYDNDRIISWYFWPQHPWRPCSRAGSACPCARAAGERDEATSRCHTFNAESYRLGEPTRLRLSRC